jgi:hypothetical protein
VRKSKEEHKHNLIKKLINENSSGSNWWKTVKQLTGIKSRDHGIPPLVKNDNLIFDDIEKAIEFNIFFAAQSNIDDCNGTPPNEIQSLIENLEYIVLKVPLKSNLCLTSKFNFMMFNSSSIPYYISKSSL